MKYIYGPIRSRRLGLSLGVSLTPYKVCSFDCVYCQLGRTTQKTGSRAEYVNIDEILGEVKSWLSANSAEAKKLDYITFSGAGEPTLNVGIGRLISGIKAAASVPVAVLTNSSHLSDPQVRREISAADLIVPSLDAAAQNVFEKIDKPEKGIEISRIIDGLAALRKEFRGKIWLEVMLIKGINDSPEHIAKLKEAILRIDPDKIQLNSPVRKTMQQDVACVDDGRMEEIAAILGGKTEIF
jgi:wyosine [tRNA(Phe)-imidazoG37] synthetase (radical SAM superfamily)